jgi:hypothetical protein
VDIVEEFQKSFSKIMTLYDKESKDVIDIYLDIFKEYLDSPPEYANFGKPPLPTKVKTSKKVFLKDVVPELFTSSYSRACRNQPKIIKEKDIKDYASALLYPKSPEEGTQRLYACDPKSDHKYVGLKINNPTSEYRFVPCCYKIDQQTDPSSWLNLYNSWKPGEAINDECLVDSDSAQQKITTTRKIARYNAFGFMPFPEIDSVFKYALRGDSEHHFLRKGVDKSRLSFLQCVFEGIGHNYTNNTNCASRMDEIKAIVEHICDKRELMCLAKQSLFNKSEDEIRNIIENRNMYFDPRYFIPLLEYYFECKIFVFTDKELLIPHHAQNYIQFSQNHNTRVVVIIEHEGIEGENNIHPQCELVVKAHKTDKTDVVVVNYSQTDEIALVTKKIFDNMVGSTTFNKNVTYYTLENEFGGRVIGQMLNSYGKATIILVEFGKKLIPLYAKTPMPPLATRAITYDFIFPPLLDIQTVIDFLGASVFVSRKMCDDSVEVLTNVGNTYFIPLLRKNIEIGLEKSTEKIHFPVWESAIEEYNLKRRISHYLSEYCKYLLSYFLYQTNRDENDIDGTLIQAFVDGSVILDNNYQYSYADIPSKFGVADEGFVREGKIIVNSIELLNRLIYFLLSNKESLSNYYTKTAIEENFEDLTDFNVHPLQVVIYGKNALIQYMKQSLESHTLSNRIFMDKEDEVYFFRNTFVGGGKRTYLARSWVYEAEDDDELNETVEYRRAISCINNWRKNGFANHLPTITEEDEEDFNVSILNYVNEDTIFKINNTGSDDAFLVVTDLGDKYVFTALVTQT